MSSESESSGWDLPDLSGVEAVTEGRGALCRAILDTLPQWFGIPAAVEDYVRAVETMPMFAVRRDGQRVGFVAVAEHYDQAVEIHVMGVELAHHRRGVGRVLMAAVEDFARSRGRRFVTVKTVSASLDNAEYARTRAFYRGVGFVELEEFPTLWGERNPCVLMIKIV